MVTRQDHPPPSSPFLKWGWGVVSERFKKGVEVSWGGGGGAGTFPI